MGLSSGWLAVLLMLHQWSSTLLQSQINGVVSLCSDLYPNWCQQTITYAGLCYYTIAVSSCCSTCNNMKVSNLPGCEYGDRVTWCSNIVQVASQCYLSDIQSNCCYYCATYFPTTTTTTTTTTTPPIQANIILAEPEVSCNDLYPAWCQQTITYPGVCYEPGAVTDCCATCQSMKLSNISGCEFGDQVLWCRDRVQEVSQCYQSDIQTYCCYYCYTHFQVEPVTTGTTTSATTTTQCSDVYSDWCRTNIDYPGRCYIAQSYAACCATCRNHYTSRPACPYGDKYGWCGPDDCQSDSQDCCASCAS